MRICAVWCVLSSPVKQAHHTAFVGQISPPLLLPYLPFSFITTLPFLPSSCSPTQFLFGSGLFCCIFLDGLHDDHKCQRASAGLEMQTIPQRDVESSCCRHCCGINWRPGHLLVTQHRQIGFWILEWFEVARYCRRLLLSHCRGMSAAEAAPGCRLCLLACVCVSAWWLQLNSAFSQDVLNRSTITPRSAQQTTATNQQQMISVLFNYFNCVKIH